MFLEIILSEIPVLTENRYYFLLKKNEDYFNN